MKSSWRSPDGGSSVARNTKIEPSEVAFCAWWGTGSMPIRSFHTVSEAELYEVRYPLARPKQPQRYAFGVIRPCPLYANVTCVT
jgi:hypothetical protein